MGHSLDACKHRNYNVKRNARWRRTEGPTRVLEPIAPLDLAVQSTDKGLTKSATLVRIWNCMWKGHLSAYLQSNFD
ncbi:hypothetical protein Pdw03_4498 [Penicillium digitatum]|uniref:Uncharacterized protein n=1 Tax=Penicillium digitatum TaxID=36651 RepID=A0A7T7BJ38_PENDI|nr:hypothetical protein Pdw03_4498 [Penicillium digitatum]